MLELYNMIVVVKFVFHAKNKYQINLLYNK